MNGPTSTRTRSLARRLAGLLSISMTLAPLALVVAPGAAHASPVAHVFVVDDTTDQPDEDFDDGRCETAAGTCTLRAAVMEANEQPGADVIVLPAGHYRLNATGIPATSGDLAVNDTLTIRGAGAEATVIDGVKRSTIFSVDEPSDRTVGLTIEAVTLEDSTGSAIDAADGTLTVRDSVLRGNFDQQEGGAIDAGGLVVVERSTFVGNRAGAGGAVNTDGPVHVVDSVFEGNRTLNYTVSRGGLEQAATGGAIRSYSSVQVSGSTFTGNDAREGGAISARLFVEIDSSTFETNRAAQDGGAVYSQGRIEATGVTVIANEARSIGANSIKALATQGGGFYAEGDLEVSDSHFEANEATGTGTALFSGGDLSVLDSTFEANETHGCDAEGSQTFTRSDSDDPTCA